LGAAQGAAHSGVENRQCHSADCVAARSGESALADGLWSDRPELVLAVYTADCVPILIAAEDRRAAVHAGWRGLATGVIDTAVSALAKPPRELTAWIGPAMAGCCYEVGAEVAVAVARRSGCDVVLETKGPRPHLDLPRAALAQLERAGICDLRLLRHCTGCDPERWWSYRKTPAAGRNYALIWGSRSGARAAI
jgi:hypothetical protein